MLEAPQPLPLETIVTVLINEIATLPGPVLLVLDDYHAIQTASIHESLNFLLDHAPKGFMVVITTREDPPLSLARRRGRGQITEIRAADLRFTPDETGEFINAVMRLNLPAGELKTLESHTEGWIVGLQMAAIALASMAESQEGQAAREAFVNSFAGYDRYIAD